MPNVRIASGFFSPFGAISGMRYWASRRGPSCARKPTMSDQPPVPDRKQLTPAAQRALAEAEARRQAAAVRAKTTARRRQRSCRGQKDPSRPAMAIGSARASLPISEACLLRLACRTARLSPSVRECRVSIQAIPIGLRTAARHSVAGSQDCCRGCSWSALCVAVVFIFRHGTNWPFPHATDGRSRDAEIVLQQGGHPDRREHGRCRSHH